MCPVGSTDNQRSHTWKCQSESFSNDSCFKLKECDTDVYDDEQISSFLSVCLYYPCFTTLCFTFLMKAIKPSKKQVLYIYIYITVIYIKNSFCSCFCAFYECVGIRGRVKARWIHIQWAPKVWEYKIYIFFLFILNHFKLIIFTQKDRFCTGWVIKAKNYTYQWRLYMP